MVIMRVRQHDEVDVTVPEWDALVEAPHEQVRVRAAVHEQARAVRGLDEDGVALAHVEDGDPERRCRPEGREDPDDCHERGPESRPGSAGGLVVPLRDPMPAPSPG